MPVRAIVLTLIGDFIYLNFGVSLFIGFAVSGLLSYSVTVLFITTVGVVGCVVMMAVRPKMHLVWGVLVLALSAWAIAADGSFLYGSYGYTSSVVGPIAIVGVIIWSIPLVLVLLGGVLAIRWKPTASPSGTPPLA
jgi:hypothetical protein